MATLTHKSQATAVGGDGDLCLFADPWRVSCARLSAACVAALGGACFFFGFPASATILWVIYRAISGYMP